MENLKNNSQELKQNSESKKTMLVKFLTLIKTLCAIAGILSLVIFIPFVRELIIGLGEKGVGRPLNHGVWHKALIDYEMSFIFFISIAYFVVYYMKISDKKSISLYSFAVSKIQKISADEWLHYISLSVFILFLCIRHFCIIPSGDDVNYFDHALQDSSYLDFLKYRYTAWSSRLIIETVLINCYWANFGIWRLLNVAVFVLIAECFIKLCLPQKRYACFVYLILLLFTDFRSLQSAGWGATTVNYLWPLACTMPYFVVIKDIFDGKNLSKKIILFSFTLLLFAINQEQVAALIFGLNLSFFIMRLAKNHKIEKNDFYLLTIQFICILSLVFILTCPGNSVRFDAEIGRWFPEYTTLSFFEKCQLGIITIFTYYFSLKLNFVIVPLLCILTVIFYRKNRLNFYLQIALDALAALCAVTYYLGFVTGKSFLLSNARLSQFSVHSEIGVLIECLFLLAMGILFLYQIFCSFENKTAGIFNIFLLAAGFCSAFIIAFSPTVYASGSRCYLFMSYIIFYITFNSFYNLVSDKNEAKIPLKQND